MIMTAYHGARGVRLKEIADPTASEKSATSVLITRAVMSDQISCSIAVKRK